MADHLTYELHLPREWTIWRAYKRHAGQDLTQRCDCQYTADGCSFGFGDIEVYWDETVSQYVLQDPVDGPNYQDAVAFPSHKPSVDVFGPPCRSRAQRGWYQVKTWPSRSQYQVATSNTPRFIHLPETFPQELLKRILDYCIDNGHRSGNARGELARCGRVCRFWADHCRISLFASLSLSSQSDMQDLQDFQEDTRCLFFPYLDEIVIEQDGSKHPWLHNFIPGWRAGNFVRVQMQRPLPAGLRSVRSVHAAVPRNLPRYFSVSISSVDLYDLKLHRFHDLLHLIGELPDLQELQCIQVTWSNQPTELPRRRPTIALNRLYNWELIQCKLNNTVVVIYPFLHVYPSASFFSENDVPRMNALMTTFGLDDQDCTVSYSAIEEEKALSQNTIRLSLSTLSFMLSLQGGIASPSQESEEAPEYQVTRICIELLARAMNSEKPMCEWAKFDAAANAFPALSRVTFGSTQRQQLLKFMSEVSKEQLPQLSSRNLVKYAIGVQTSPRVWYELSQDTYEARGPGKPTLEELYA